MVIKSVGVVSVGKMYGAMMASIGLIAGLFIALASMVGAGMSSNDDLGMFGPMLGVGAVIALPILYGCFGFIGGLIGGALYNLFAAMVGGVEIRTE